MENYSASGEKDLRVPSAPHKALAALRGLKKTYAQIAAKAKVDNLKAKFEAAKAETPQNKEKIKTIGLALREATNEQNAVKEEMEKSAAPLISTIVALTHQVLQSSPYGELKTISSEKIRSYVEGGQSGTGIEMQSGDALAEKLKNVMPTRQVVDANMFSRTRLDAAIDEIAREITGGESKDATIFSLDWVKEKLESFKGEITIHEEKWPQVKAKITVLGTKGNVYFELQKLITHNGPLHNGNEPLDPLDAMAMVEQYVEWKLEEAATQGKVSQQNLGREMVQTLFGPQAVLAAPPARSRQLNRKTLEIAAGAVAIAALAALFGKDVRQAVQGCLAPNQVSDDDSGVLTVESLAPVEISPDCPMPRYFYLERDAEGWWRPGGLDEPGWGIKAGSWHAPQGLGEGSLILVCPEGETRYIFNGGYPKWYPGDFGFVNP